MGLNPIEGQPGLFRDSDTDTIVNIRDFREGDVYDTIMIPSVEALTPGTSFEFFLNIQNKRNIDTNLKTSRKMSAGESMVMDRIGLYFRLATGNIITFPRDIKKVVENSFYRLEINGILQDSGPAVKFPSSYGIYGQTTETDAGIVSVGVPATASASRLIKKQLLNQNHELDGELQFNPRQWLINAGMVAGDINPDLEQNMLVTNFLHGLIRSAVTK